MGGATSYFCESCCQMVEKIKNGYNSIFSTFNSPIKRDLCFATTGSSGLGVCNSNFAFPVSAKLRLMGLFGSCSKNTFPGFQVNNSLLILSNTSFYRSELFTRKILEGQRDGRLAIPGLDIRGF